MMSPWTLTLWVLLSACCVTQPLKCYHCIDISKTPNCSHPDEMECSPPHSYCLNITMHHPAYGAVRRCATPKDCSSIDSGPQHLMEALCCSNNLCN